MMARPIPSTAELNLRAKSKNDVEELNSNDSKSIFDISDRVSNNTSKNFMLGTFSGWMAGMSVIRVGRIAAFGLGGGIILLHFAMTSAKPMTAVALQDLEQSLPPEPIPPKPPEPFRLEEANIFEPTTFLPPKPIPHSLKISPSSIPNPNPSVSTTKPVESGYSNYGGFLYSIPGYSAFQPVNHSGLTTYSGLAQQSHMPDPSNADFLPFPKSNPILPSKESVVRDGNIDTDEGLLMITDDEDLQKPPPETHFEDHFTPEIISTTSIVPTTEEIVIQTSESMMSIASLAQCSGVTVTVSTSLPPSKEIKKKPEKFSLKTSIPISKIDLKCVNNPPDISFQNSLSKKQYHSSFLKDTPRVAIQSNIVIKSAINEFEGKDALKPAVSSQSGNFNTLINAAETIIKTDNQFRATEPPQSDPQIDSKNALILTKPLFNPINIDPKTNCNKTSDRETFSNDHNNQILFIQNKNNNNQNPKMVLTIQPQNPQVLLQRTNFDSKNLQAPSRLPNLNNKCKEDVSKESTSSKVVALKRLHQENCDENDFENLITENQIYGNKIVVKEKSQGMQQAQDLNTKKAIAEKVTNESKNLVLQPNFLYLSNVQFPNMMIVKNNTKVTQVDGNKLKVASNDIKAVNENLITLPLPEISSINSGNKNAKLTPPTVSKEMQVLKTNYSVVQPLPIKPNTELMVPNSEIITTPETIFISKPDNKVTTKSDKVIAKSDVIIQTNQKVIMNPKIVYQVPVLFEGDKINPSAIMNINTKKISKFTAPKRDYSKQFEPLKVNDKLYITCPYQIDSKLKPKIVITNLLPKLDDEVSALDIYEKRRRLRRLKHLSNRENIINKDGKMETNNICTFNTSAKKIDKTDFRNIITPEKMQKEIYKEFIRYKGRLDNENSGSDSDEYDDGELKHYESIMEEYGTNVKSPEEDKRKSEFLVNFRLASQEAYKEQDLDLQERMLKLDRVRSAYATIGRLDLILNDSEGEEIIHAKPDTVPINFGIVKERNLTTTRKKTMFLSRLRLTQVTQKFKEGYEKAWEIIIQERQRRNSVTDKNTNCITTWPSVCLDTKGQLQLMSEIQQSVTENNNLIKRMLDTVNEKQSNEESISVLAEKNFSELNRLSKMADRSVKLVSGQNTRKRDLNPGFDSENIQKQRQKIELKFHDYPKLNIPDISKIISLKSMQEYQNVSTTKATSMDEPHSSAAGVNEMFFEEIKAPCKNVDASCQVDEYFWPGMEYFIKSYKEHDANRRREVMDLHRRNTSLRVEGAHITRSASRDSDSARALLAERQNLAVEENNLRLSIQRLRVAIDEVRNYTGQHDFC